MLTSFAQTLIELKQWRHDDSADRLCTARSATRRRSPMPLAPPLFRCWPRRCSTRGFAPRRVATPDLIGTSSASNVSIGRPAGTSPAKTRSNCASAATHPQESVASGDTAFNHDLIAGEAHEFDAALIILYSTSADIASHKFSNLFILGSRTQSETEMAACRQPRCKTPQIRLLFGSVV